MFDNQPTNPQIVAQIQSLADGWKELLGPEEKPPRRRKTTGKRKIKS
jgi:hypothetical protein